MWQNLKHRLRGRLLGRRLQERLLRDHVTLARFGNRHYYGHGAPSAPGFRPGIEAFEFGCHSQNGEDGVILHLLSRIGAAGHRAVEIGTGDGRECNSANLVLNFGWGAALFEASRADAEAAGAYFRSCGAGERVRVHHVAAAPENINRLLRDAGAEEGIDVLSIDIDSTDYWLWRAVDETIRPRLVVMEYNASLGPARSLSVPRSFEPRPRLQSYHGASLTALTRLAEGKGYTLAGCESRGINAFYVRADLARTAGVPALTPEQAFHPHYWRSRTRTPEAQFAQVKDLPWEEV